MQFVRGIRKLLKIFQMSIFQEGLVAGGGLRFPTPDPDTPLGFLIKEASRQWTLDH